MLATLMHPAAPMPQEQLGSLLSSLGKPILQGSVTHKGGGGCGMQVWDEHVEVTSDLTLTHFMLPRTWLRCAGCCALSSPPPQPSRLDGCPAPLPRSR